ncbi:MAG: hypothetical protein L3J07_00230 [Candidatus Magasanikbacteria bacterium]|nr:hypothetical protein [Candidatus Magasanikbacteria bacterium]
MEDIRKRLLIIIGLVSFTVIIVVVIILAVTGGENKGTQQVEDLQQENVEEIFEIEEVVKRAPTVEDMPPQNPEEVSAKQTARLFVERFQTYSNQNDNKHIDDVIHLVTDSMAVWVRAQKVDKSLDYEGVTTQILASNVSNLESSSVTVNIEARQTVENSEGENTEQKSGRIELVKVSGEWKVSGFFWD